MASHQERQALVTLLLSGEAMHSLYRPHRTCKLGPWTKAPKVTSSTCPGTPSTTKWPMKQLMLSRLALPGLLANHMCTAQIRHAKRSITQLGTGTQ